METKKEVFLRYKKEYFKARKQKGRRKELTAIINTIHNLTSLTRKSIIRTFKRLQTKESAHSERRGRRVYYTPDVTAALKDIWEAGSEVCGELLHPMVPEYVSIFIRDKVWTHSDEASGKLLAMSMGTMKDRIGEFEKIDYYSYLAI